MWLASLVPIYRDGKRLRKADKPARVVDAGLRIIIVIGNKYLVFCVCLTPG